RDGLMILGLIILKRARCPLHFEAHLSGKLATASQMLALAWVTFGFTIASPVWACVAATVCTAWSALVYFKQGAALMNKS
ncbi:MAG TPA: hypothetical protein VFY13_10315, partial [Luteolibacter sp.]|nr:hypothetical protein [Luteolibacter sp.]